MMGILPQHHISHQLGNLCRNLGEKIGQKILRNWGARRRY